MKSKETKKYGKIVLILTLISFLLMTGPAIGYIIAGLCITVSAGETTVVIAGTAFAALIFLAICITLKHIPRTLPWIVMLALFLVLDNLLVMVVVFAATQILDEVVVTPLLKFYRQTYNINKQIDKRGI